MLLCLKLLNCSPLNAKTVSVDQFKMVILKWLINKAVYNIDEYFSINFNDLQF